jgi:hypothetical protein
MEQKGNLDAKIRNIFETCKKTMIKNVFFFKLQSIHPILEISRRSIKVALKLVIWVINKS